ncbi:MAG: hydroxyacid dehydrogenase [Caldilineaceae bacterium]|nr:hydroxyacid dehydrogenase [Caldilineaceae bacterium]
MAQNRKILYLPPAGLSENILSPQAVAILESLGTVFWNETGRNYTSDELLEMLPGAAAVITSWGSPQITEEHVAAADELQIVGHAAGSVKTRLAPAGHERGIVLLSAADVIAESVAEYTLWAMLSGQRNLLRYERVMKQERGWKSADEHFGHSLYAKKIGVVSASMVGRRVIGLLKPFGCDVMVYDPYLSDEDARLLDVRPVTLEELFAAADIISVHAPITPETRRMITRAHFESIRDGALFVHTARTWVLDQEALTAELQKNRFNAFIDVFEPEPLPADHPLRDLDNVFLSPHVSGHTSESRLRLVEEIARDIQRFFNDQPLRLAVPYEKLSIMA